MEHTPENKTENISEKAQQKLAKLNGVNLWKYTIPVIFFMLSLVLILQNILLNNKIDKISASIENSVIEGGKTSQTKIEELDKKISDTLLALDTSNLKDNKTKLDEIKSMLQEIRGISFDGGSTQNEATQNSANVDSSESIGAQIAANTSNSVSTDSKIIEVTNIDYYSTELDKIKNTIDSNEKEHTALKLDLYNISEKLIKEYNDKNPTPEVEKDKTILSGIVKIKKISDSAENGFVEKVKTAAILFENNEITESAKLLEDINAELKNIELNELINRLKKYNDSVLDMPEIVSKLDAIVKGLKEIAK